ncbi:hypothetical protein GOY07_03425 [Wolbachia endosymbiont of Litomosoides sigmodontis]|uniref:hypothetical protein n=1 Tax=Wolbachia endosymbiont of Litomosoides sigmodontis TaxID=80850 RepID=UPI00158F2D83|nr:hypothetical protein [Wolbachia endosymbiont of Litomosoides sigmodontis]QKX03202.1 hypothetical protein GOY07_03425 [Wolbachia endosymbiont of Litomosoides sigmodontis]
MKFSVMPRPIHNEQDEGKQEELKKLNETIGSILNKSYSSLINRRFSRQLRSWTWVILKRR